MQSSTPRGWDRFLTAQDKEVFSRAGYGADAGLGSRPAVLVVDATTEFCGPDRPTVEVVASAPLACGDVAWRAVAEIRRLLRFARRAGLPVIYSAMQPRGRGSDAGGWAAKRRASTFSDASSVAGVVVPALRPRAGELVIAKAKPSVFHGTALRAHLEARDVHTLILCGGTTSGCVRATAVDAFSFDYRVVVVEDGCFDRGQTSHWVSLFDLQQKYADVISAADLIKRLQANELAEQHRAGRILPDPPADILGSAEDVSESSESSNDLQPSEHT